MFIDKYKIFVMDNKFDEKKNQYEKHQSVIASVSDESGLCSKHFGKFLEDLEENNPTFQHCDVEVEIKMRRR